MGSTALPFDGYVRVSRVNGRAGESFLSPKLQRDTIERLALGLGVTLGEVVEELDVSGKTPMEKRALGRLIEKVERGESGGIIVWKLTRFSRDLLDGVTAAVRVSDAGGRLVGSDYSTDNKAIMGFLFGWAEEELDARRAGWKAATESAVERGVYVGATPPGYDRLDGGLLPDGGTVKGGKKDGRLVKNQHAPAIERAFRVRANGGSWSEAARVLNEAGVPTSAGHARWGLTSVKSMMGNPIYKGELRNGHVHQFPEYLIVPPSIWARVNKRADAPGRKDGGAWAVLGGLMFCGGCGYRMAPSHTTRGRGPEAKVYRAYECRAHGQCDEKARINQDEIESLVAETAYERFADLIARDGIGRDADVEKLGTLEIERDECARRLERFLKAASLDDDGFEERVAELREAKQAAQRAIEDEKARTRRFPTADEVRAIIDTGTVEERRQVIRQVVHGVTVWRKGIEPHDVPRELGGLRGDPLGGGDPFSGDTTPHRVEVAWRTNWA
jgi:site-specific DNA recombinase